MGWLKPRRWWLASLLTLLAIGNGSSPGQGPPQVIPGPLSSYFDPKLEPIRRATASWANREGPNRTVVDQVCLVPDLPTFLAAVASWDEGHYFPVLFDDVESSFRFIRAFRPLRIVRMPKVGAPIAPGAAWARAVEAVGASWASGSASGTAKLRGDAFPVSFGPTPPGVVVTSPSSPMLAGAIALAAGRFQPLVRLDSTRRFADVLSVEEVAAFANAIADKVKERTPDFERLGDDCDFLTLAGDYPYRYKDAKGELEAVDDRIGRVAGPGRRWAFAGRLLGDPIDSAYRGMCSLFLQPETALMFNGYEEATPPWSIYAMRTAALRSSSFMKTSQFSGDDQADLKGWHEAFDPINRAGLVLINSHGSPTEFNLRGGPAHAPDVPRSVPSSVLMIHSFSAADPGDPRTVAGRWLANGAFNFFGSMNEPYLDAFRTPRLVGEMISQRVPLVVAARQTLEETRGMPWRLVFLGDPLYRVRRKAGVEPSPRLEHWEPTDRWPAYEEGPRPVEGSDVELFLWTLKSSLAKYQGIGPGLPPAPSDDLVETLLSIRRAKLPAELRGVHDALLIEILLDANRRSELRLRLAAIPEADRTPQVRRTIETMANLDLHLAIARKDLSKARIAWLELMKTGAVGEFKQQLTARVGRLADTPERLREWRSILRAAARDRTAPPESEIIAAELKRVGAELVKTP